MTASTEMPAAFAAPAVPALEPPGLRGAFRLLLEHLGDHLNLLRVETGQELGRFGAVLGCWFALALLVQLGLMLGLALLVAHYWQTEYRPYAIAFSVAVIAAGAGYCLWQLKQLSQRAAQRFLVSGQQWKRDLDLIRELI